MKWHRVLAMAMAAAALGASFAVGFEYRHQAVPASAPAPPSQALRVEVLEELEAHYYRVLPPAAYRAHTVGAVLHVLGDPYTRYLRPAAYTQLRTAESGTYPGVGLGLGHDRRGLRVTESLPGLPGRLAGIKPGDVITTVNGTTLASLSYRRALDLMGGGRAGSAVHLRVLRRGIAHALSLTLVRTAIVLPYVSSHVVRFAGVRVRVIRLRAFPATAAAAVRRSARAAVRSHEPVVLDLRGNPGGLLAQAVAVVRVFAGRGVVVTTKGLHEPAHRFTADRTAVGKLRLAVLIDGGTASAAEVTAGALRADAGAILVGRRSFGKGTVQAVVPLAGGGALKLTVARYTLGAGTVVEGRGIRPTIHVPSGHGAVDTALQAALRAVTRR